jgi:pyridoxine 4-dehydrogenase
LTITSNPVPSSLNATFTIGGDMAVRRLAFGSMRLTGVGIWGEPEDPTEARAVLRRAVELGVNLIDTADAYGPEVSERLIAEVLYPYPSDLVIVTKGGRVRAGPGQWATDSKPKRLVQVIEGSLRRLRLERIDLYMLHGVDPEAPIEDSVGALADLQAQGKIRHIGVCNVEIEQLERAQKVANIVAVQNRYNVTQRQYDPLLDLCESGGIGFMPFWPLAVGALAKPGSRLEDIARPVGATPSQLALAWLLKRASNVLPIPGTSKVSHLEENMAAASLELSDEDYSALAELGAS